MFFLLLLIFVIQTNCFVCDEYLLIGGGLCLYRETECKNTVISGKLFSRGGYSNFASRIKDYQMVDFLYNHPISNVEENQFSNLTYIQNEYPCYYLSQINNVVMMLYWDSFAALKFTTPRENSYLDQCSFINFHPTIKDIIEMVE